MSNQPLFTTTPMIKGRYAEPEPEVQAALADGTVVLVPPWIANDWRFHGPRRVVPLRERDPQRSSSIHRRAP